MKTSSKLSALLASTLLLACAGEGAGPVIEFGEGNDALADYNWQPDITDELSMEEMKLDGSFTAIIEDNGSMTVQGPVYVLDVPKGGEMNIELRAPLLESLTDDMQFLLLTQDERGNWKPKELWVDWEQDGLENTSLISTLDSMRYSPKTGKLTGVNGAIGEFELDTAALEGDQLGVFPLPEDIGLHEYLAWHPDNHRKIEGTHEYVLKADCNGAVCKKAGPFRDEPEPEPEPEPETAPGVYKRSKVSPGAVSTDVTFSREATISR